MSRKTCAFFKIIFSNYLHANISPILIRYVSNCKPFYLHIGLTFYKLLCYAFICERKGYYVQ